MNECCLCLCGENDVKDGDWTKRLTTTQYLTTSSVDQNVCNTVSPLNNNYLPLLTTVGYSK